jgi:hypothetical protein
VHKGAFMKRNWMIWALGLAAGVTLTAQSTSGVNPLTLKGPNVLDYVVSPNNGVSQPIH